MKSQDPKIIVRRIRVLWVNRKGELTPRYAFRPFDAAGEPLAAPQSTPQLARSAVRLNPVTP
jgi:hypothetical protein